MDDENIVIAIDAHSFPKHCDALNVLKSVVRCNTVDINTDSPRVYLNKCGELATEYDLVIPCTRNMFVRDYLINNDVDCVINI